MQKSRLLSVLLCVTLLFLSVFVPPAAAATQGKIITNKDPASLREEPKKTGKKLIGIPKGEFVTINGTAEGEEAVSGSGTTWYNVTYQNKTGYVYGKYVEVITVDPDFEKNLLNFPESYRAALRAIHSEYPNWIFKADKVGISLDAAINLEHNAGSVTKIKKYVELAYGVEWRDPRADVTNKEHIRESRWTFASRNAIAFFMDPRNALTVTAAKASYPNIFTFMEQSYDGTTQTVEGLRTIVAGTFLNTDSYISIIMDAATASGVSPYIIASTIITEQGTSGTSSLISGTYPGYEGYYNFFNYGASGSNVVVNGLEYAKKQGWDSRAKSITGGAVKYGSGYVVTGQDTYYYMDFDVKNNCTHQFATSVYDQCVKANNAKKAYISNYSGALTFKIPVYSQLPESIYPAPTIENYNSQPSPTPSSDHSRRKGDYDGDGQVTVKELATIRMYLLGVKQLSPEECGYLDVTGDNELTVKDLATVRMYLLGLVTI